jgi:hypothetical protein
MSAPVSRSAPEVLDLGSMGAKAAGRAALRLAQNPAFWATVIALIVVIYLLTC